MPHSSWLHNPLTSHARRQPRVACVLSGGGSRASFQLGALDYLYRHDPGFTPSIFVGASAGAILASGLAQYSDHDDQHRFVPLAPSPEASRAVGPMLSEPFFAEVTIGATMLARGLTAWTLLLGAVTSEVFAQLGPIPDAAALFRLHLEVAGSLILQPAQPSTGLSTAVFTA